MKAVVFIDVQKDFIDGALRNEMAIAVTPKIVEFAKTCVADSDCKLYATRDTHEATQYVPNYNTENGSETEKVPFAGYYTTLEGQKLPVEHCINETSGWMIDERLMEVLKYKCTFINKNTFGSLHLADTIHSDDMMLTNAYNHIQSAFQCHKLSVLDEIILCGFCTDICVISNALLLRAKFPNTKITVMKDLCAGITVENHNNALEVMKMCQIDVI